MSTKSQWLAPLISLVLLSGIWIEGRLFHLPLGNADDYHEQVVAAADRLPQRIGDWVATKTTPPPAAVALLRPNLLWGRRFVNSETGEDVSMVVVQCRDARDMSGHYPPICYCAHGWTKRETSERVVRAANLDVPITVYHFAMESIDRYAEIVIYNFFVRPDGMLEGGQQGVQAAAADRRLKVFGAAQVQVMFGPSMTSERKDEVFRTLLTGTWSLIDTIRRGIGR